MCTRKLPAGTRAISAVLERFIARYGSLPGYPLRGFIENCLVIRLSPSQQVSLPLNLVTDHHLHAVSNYQQYIAKVRIYTCQEYHQQTANHRYTLPVHAVNDLS